MELIELTVEERSGFGSGAIRRLRKHGMVPAVIYSQGKPAVSLQIERLHLRKKTMGMTSTHLYQLKSQSKALDGVMALIKDTQIDALRQEVTHVDFYEIHAGHKIIVTVPVVLIGESAAVKQKTAILAQALHEVEVECQPTDIPERLELDITALVVGDSLFASDLKLPEGAKLKTEKSQNIVTAVAPKEEVAASPAAGVEGAAETQEATSVAASSAEAKPDAAAAKAKGKEKKE